MNAITPAVPVSLDDKWTIDRGRILLNGTQALARVLLAQSRLDAKAGLKTGGYVSGYRGSPLGNVDNTLWSIGARLKAAGIVFNAGVNEDLAATALRGTQQLDILPDPRVEGVFAAWYGKGPGVDRSIDALKHGNFAGTHPKGGVLVFYGDDHAGKSSTVAHQSEPAMASALIPSLYPANVAEILRFGQLAYAMSRYSGSWVGMKLVNEVVEQTASVEIDLDAFAPILPPYGALPPEGVHIRSAYGPLREEQIVSEHRLPLVQAFVRANDIDVTAFRAPTPRLALVAAGKSYSDTRQALDMLGLDDVAAQALGVSLYKIGCIWPLEPTRLVEFASGHETVFVVEEKQGFLENQVAAALINTPARSRLIGKRDEDGAMLISPSSPVEPLRLALMIAERLRRLGVHDTALSAMAEALGAPLSTMTPPNVALPARSPFFCSGCPHNRSTKVPKGSLSMTGIGCHTMVAFVRPKEALLPTQMGGEGANWIGLAPFSGTKHIFQNMGDGTYYHSGLLAIRAAVASGVNITYKILYNDAVAMTGGQPVDGPISVEEIAQQVRHEGVATIWLLSDQPERHMGKPGLPPNVKIEHRDELDAVQRQLRETPGCSVLIYEQTCAAEKRRRRKRGEFPNPPKRLFISEAVCEGCGDCSVQSTCVSVTPVETEFGTKRKIDQSSCNKDYSCLNGFCPSFITVHGAEPRKPAATKLDPALLEGLPAAGIAPLGAGYNMMVTGIGGTGVITVGAVLGMAAHLEGRAVSLFDMTGLAQKNGAVFSHIKIAEDPSKLHAQRLGHGEADALIAFDAVAAVAAEASTAFSAGRTRALVNSDVSATVAFQFDRDNAVDGRLLLNRLKARIGEDAVSAIAATRTALALLGDTIGANMFMVGVAAQRGLLPIGVAAIEGAIRLNGAAVAFNLSAFRLGRLYAHDPAKVEALMPTPASARKPVAKTLDEIVEARAAHLEAYQDRAYAERYRVLLQRVREAEARVAPGNDALSTAVARGYAKVLAYKDEYEVARLLTSPALMEELKGAFAEGARLGFNMAPPILGGPLVNGRPRKREFSAKWMLPLLRVMAKGKSLRGTAFDLFGRTEERRMERRLIEEYERVVAGVLAMLGAENHRRAVQVVSLIDQVRGFGPVKLEAVTRYRAALGDALKALGPRALAA